MMSGSNQVNQDYQTMGISNVICFLCTTCDCVKACVTFTTLPHLGCGATQVIEHLLWCFITNKHAINDVSLFSLSSQVEPEPFIYLL